MTEYRTLLSNFIKKSTTVGLMKNDGTIDTTDYVDTNDSRLSDTRNPKSHTHLSSDTTDLIDVIYPVGSIYMSINSTDPSTLFGGSWTRLKDTFLLACGDTYSSDGDVATSQHGSATVTLTSAQSGVPAHSHKYQDYNTTYTLKTTNRKPGTSTAVAYGTSLTAGGGATERTSSNNTAANASQAHNNMPPYMAVYMWKRTS